MATTKGRYQTHENKNEFFRWSVIDTEGKTLGERHIGAFREETKATHVADALNFYFRPSDYGYKLVN